jgi:hypothetical protein
LGFAEEVCEDDSSVSPLINVRDALDSKTSWYDHTDLEKAKEEAARTKKPILHVFDYVNSGCTYCEWMRTNIYPTPEIKELFSKYIVVHRVMNNLKNTIQESKVERQYNIKKYPSHQFETVIEVAPGKYASIMWPEKIEGWMYKADFIKKVDGMAPPGSSPEAK